MSRPNYFVDESLDLRALTEADTDGRVVKMGKFLLRHVFSSVRLTIVHSRVLRRYLSLKCCPDPGDTLSKLIDLMDNDATVLDVIETKNGAMVSEIDADKMRLHLSSITSRWLRKRGKFVANDPDTGLYKKLLRLKFLFDHFNEVYSDKYNIYQAAYVDSAYTVRALLCFVMQMISVAALMKDGGGGGDTSVTEDDRGVVDVILIIVTIMFMFFNLPANSITSSMSHNVLLVHIFGKARMYGRVVFAAMDLFVNSLILSLMPLVSARLLYKTADSTSIVATSLSVFFVTSLDDSAITKSESNNMSLSQTALLRCMAEKVDEFRDPDMLSIAAFLPWVEMLLLLASVTSAYFVLL